MPNLTPTAVPGSHREGVGAEPTLLELLCGRGAAPGTAGHTGRERAEQGDTTTGRGQRDQTLGCERQVGWGWGWSGRHGPHDLKPGRKDPRPRGFRHLLT